MRTTTIKTEFKQWQPLPVVTPEPSEPLQVLGVPGANSEDPHRFVLDAQPASESGVSPVSRQQPKMPTRTGTALKPSAGSQAQKS